ncbi:hypothetical protein D3C87_268430 [compost metagenome]|uniref:hypothetical protein n=1 Tax=unclassified Flavobacterium TaxID=196869 RepID=UPI000FB8091F|nr:MULTISPECIES: hypothetical protein [unclassified Flavobacterium]WDO11477.1 hypothetical protein MH928_09050 [Flavobacterium sp. WW92]
MIKNPPCALVYMALLLFVLWGCEEEKHIVTYNNLDLSELKDHEHLSKDSIICYIISQHQEVPHTADSADYESHYDVVGSDKEGNMVTGYADIEGKHGKGAIEDDMGNEIEVDVEWIGKDRLAAKDQEGNNWELVVE